MGAAPSPGTAPARPVEAPLAAEPDRTAANHASRGQALSDASRILVTGSRNWTDARLIHAALAQFAAPGAVVVHGGAPGADTLAARAAADLGLTVEAHPADWVRCVPDCPPRHRKTAPYPWHGTYCPAAGSRRNQAMVDLGADVVLGFPLGRSTGTRDCMRRAARAGIPVVDMATARKTARAGGGR